jgi:23S rRNA pseudouridine1911/1915/1917 synthase
MTNSSVILTLHDPGERLDRALAKALPDLSRSQCQKLIKNGHVTISGSAVKAGQRVADGEVVTVFLPPVQSAGLIAENIPLDIRYEDDDIILINKPAGMVVHPAPGHESGTLVNAVLALCPDLPGIGNEKRPGVVHRLDKDTSGLIIMAKNDGALHHLQQQFQDRTVRKCYLALVHGRIAYPEFLIDAPIGRDLRDRKSMSVIRPDSSARSRPAQTQVTLRDHQADYSLVICMPYTGRTHQIRVHLAYIGHPIVGDSVYGQKKNNQMLGRQFLHAYELSFKRPSDDTQLSFKAELPLELSEVLNNIGLAN